eukprot:UN26998
MFFEPKPRTQKSAFKMILNIKLADAYSGCTKRMRVKLLEECTACCKKKEPCLFCNGEGKFLDIDNVSQKTT